jgi:hypothetical protein
MAGQLPQPQLAGRLAAELVPWRSAAAAELAAELAELVASAADSCPKDRPGA